MEIANEYELDDKNNPYDIYDNRETIKSKDDNDKDIRDNRKVSKGKKHLFESDLAQAFKDFGFQVPNSKMLLSGLLNKYKNAYHNTFARVTKNENYINRGITRADNWSFDKYNIKDNMLSFCIWCEYQRIQQGLSYDDVYNMSIDRIDNDKGYFPDNCKWSTYEEQSNNRSISKKITIGFQEKSLKEYCKFFNKDYQKMYDLIFNKGVKPEVAFGITAYQEAEKEQDEDDLKENLKQYEYKYLRLVYKKSRLENNDNETEASIKDKIQQCRIDFGIDDIQLF